MLRNLVFSFDSDDGQDNDIFIHAKELIAATLGGDAADYFSSCIEMADYPNRYYLPEGTAQEVWNEMLEQAKKP